MRYTLESVSFLIVLLLAAPPQMPGSVKNLSFAHWFVVAIPVTAVAICQRALLAVTPGQKGAGCCRPSSPGGCWR